MDEEKKWLWNGLGKLGLSAVFPVAAPLFFMVYDEINNGEYKRRIEDFIKKTETNFEILREMFSSQQKDNQFLSQLKDNQLFATVLSISGHLATKTNDEKRTMLANAVANSATTNLSEDEVIVFLNCFEKYTLGHLSLLFFLQDPKKFAHSEGKSISTLFHELCPMVKPELTRKFVHDLYSDGMITSESMFTTISFSGGFEKYTSSLGDNMIAFFGIEKFPQQIN